MTTTTMAQTAGQALAAELRRYFSVGTRTRRFRKDRYGCRQDLHLKMIEVIMEVAQYPGANSECVENALRPGFGVALAYDKHVNGYRINGTLHHAITTMTPWQFAALLGRMVDAGVTNTGEGERFFSAMGRDYLAAA